MLTPVAFGLQFASLFGAGLMVASPDVPVDISILGLLVVSIAGLVKQFLDSRANERREEQKHRFAMEDQAAARMYREEIKTKLQENTELTKETGLKADVALNAANGVNEKIARIAEVALIQDRNAALAEIKKDSPEH